MKGDRIGEFEELTLLAVRALNEPTYGVLVQQFVSRATGREASMGAVYAALDRLERKGYVRSVVGDPTPTRGGKRKRLFEVTPAGFKAAQELRRMREQLWRTIEGRS